MIEVVVDAVGPADVGEVLTLQRAAFVTEAQIYADPTLPALIQTYDELARELAAGPALAARLGHRMVGSVRGRQDGAVLRINRLVVAPDMQGRGIGSRLLAALEAAAPASVQRFTLFTGHLSTANLRLYQRHGYVVVNRDQLSPDVILVQLAKPVTR